jgi:agmatine deiminase
LLAQLGLESFAAPLVCEGGAISVDGQGMLLTTESVLLNANRNPGMNKAEIEEQLCAFTGSRKVIWLPGSPADPVTDGHIDGIAVFASRGVVIAELTSDPKDPEYAILRENLRALRLATDEKGRRLTVLTLLRPPFNPKWPDDFAATYVNFYLANHAVIMPAFGHPRADAAAAETISAAFPTRRIVSLRIDAIAAGGGGIHCVTQQQPARAIADPPASTRTTRKALR